MYAANISTEENWLRLLCGSFLLIKLQSSLMYRVLRKAPYESVTLPHNTARKVAGLVGGNY
jgi:hypothetical protein